MTVDPNWWETFFGEDWLLIGSGFPPERAAAQVDLLVDLLDLSDKTRVLDLACGWGRHSLELAGRGIPVVGLDYSEPSLERARESAAAAGLNVEFLHGDMRSLEFDGEFDAVVNLFTAFGYFEDAADDERTLAGVARALRPGGRFALETINPYGLAARFEPRSWSELPDGSIMLEARRLDVRRGRSEATWTLVRPDGSRSTLEHSLRLYTAAELEAMFGRAGLSPRGALDTGDGSDLTHESLRMLLVAAKEGAAAVE